MERTCEACGVSFATTRSNARSCSDACRKALQRRGRRPGVQQQAPAEPLSTDVADALARELTKLGVAASYEGVVALGIARQLDNGSVSGTAYTSLSKELDRRVAELRRRAPREDDATQGARQALQDKRLRAV